jgi:hypothetical protein
MTTCSIRRREFITLSGGAAIVTFNSFIVYSFLRIA